MKSERLFEGLPQVGGHAALDLMNTVEYRGATDPRDHLKSVGQLLRWCELAELLDKGEAGYLRELARHQPRAGEDALRGTIELREVGRKVLAGKIRGEAHARALDVLRHRIELAARRVEIVVDESGTGFVRKYRIAGFESLVDRIALAIEEALTVAARESLGECQAEDCDWLFFDRSRAGRRRWCHSGQCGNAERVRNFRTRGRAKAKSVEALNGLCARKKHTLPKG